MLILVVIVMVFQLSYPLAFRYLLYSENETEYEKYPMKAKIF